MGILKTAIVTSATGDSVTLAEARDHLRISTTEDGTLITNFITVATRRVESLTNRKLMPQTWKVYYDKWPTGDSLEIPYPMLRSISSTGVVYKDSNGDSTTFSSTAWNSDIVSMPGRLVLDYDADWPSVTLYNNNPISVEFQCGYTTAATVPENFKLAIKMLVGHYYENREASIVGPSASIVPEAVTSLLSNERIYKF